jgi:hypothetical protein
MSGWTRIEKIALYSLMVAIIGVVVALLTVPEFRYIVGLKRESTPKVKDLEQSDSQTSSPSGSITEPAGQMSGRSVILSVSRPITTKPNCLISYSSGSCWTINTPNVVPCSNLPVNRASVRISPDGLTCTLVVPVNEALGVRAEDNSGRLFFLQKGDEFDVITKGQVNFSSEHPCASPEGIHGWYDPYVNSPFSQNVGGLEFSIGSLQANRYFAGSYYKGIADSAGSPVFRVIDRLSRDDKRGAFTVTVHKLQ